MNEPAYYRDLLNRILAETDDDDIPAPPQIKDLKSYQQKRDWMRKHPSEQHKIRAIIARPSDYQYIIDPSEAVTVTMVKLQPHYINLLDNPSEAVQLAAVSTDGTAIEHIPNPRDRC